MKRVALAVMPLVLLAACGGGSSMSAAEKSSQTSKWESEADSASIPGQTMTTPAGDATTSDGSTRDSAFDKVLEERLAGTSVTKYGDDGAQLIARGICTDLDNGNSLTDEFQQVAKNFPDLDDTQQGDFMGLSIAAYCPSHKDLINK